MTAPAPNIGTILRNTQLLVEVLREDRSEREEELLGLKLRSKQNSETIGKFQANANELGENIAKQNKEIAEQKDSIENLRSRLEGVQWYLGKVANQEVNSVYLKEVHEIYLAELEERRLRANKHKVAKAHEDMEAVNERKRLLEVASRNTVMSAQKELQAEHGENTDNQDTKLVEVSVDVTDDQGIQGISGSDSVEGTQDSVQVEALEDDISDPPPQILEESNSGNAHINRPSNDEPDSGNHHHRVKKKRR